MDSEQKKIYLEHRLQVRRIILEKFIIGLIILVGGFVANKAIETYRDRLTTQKFFLEKKLEAIQSVSDAYSKMLNEYDRFSLQAYERTPSSAGVISYDRKHLDTFLLASTRWSSVLSREFCDQMNYYSWIYCAFDDLNNAKQYRKFIFDIDQRFHALCRKELGLQTDVNSSGFELEKWSYQRVHKDGAEAYAKANFEKWQRLKAGQPSR